MTQYGLTAATLNALDGSFLMTNITQIVTVAIVSLFVVYLMSEEHGKHVISDERLKIEIEKAREERRIQKESQLKSSKEKGFRSSHKESPLKSSKEKIFRSSHKEKILPTSGPDRI